MNMIYLYVVYIYILLHVTQYRQAAFGKKKHTNKIRYVIINDGKY